MSYPVHLRHDELKVAGSADLTANLDNAAAVDQGNGIVRIPATAHGYAVGSAIYIEGTTNYNGLFELQAVAANTFDIKASFVAETFAGGGAETANVVVTSGVVSKTPWELAGFAFHRDASPAGAENITFTVDNEDGSAYDFVITELTQDLNGLADYSEMLAFEKRIPLKAGDLVRVAWANAGADNYGLKIYYRKF